MVKQILIGFLFLAAQLWAAGNECPFQNNDDDMKLMDRLAASIQKFEAECKPANDSELKRKLAEMQASVEKLNSQFDRETAIGKLGTWLGMPITCGNFPSFLSDQRDDAYRRFTQGLTPPENPDYKACFNTSPSEAVFLQCIDGARDQKLQLATDFCETSFTEGQRKERDKFVGQTYSALNENLKILFETMASQCTGDPQKLREGALQTATTLATTYSAIEPMSAVGGYGIALGATALNQALSLFRKDSPQELMRKEKIIPEISCLLMETMEHELGCAKLLRTVPPAPPAPLLSAEDAKLLGASGDKNASVRAVLEVMDGVEKRAAKEMPQAKVGAAPVDFGRAPVLDELNLVLGRRVTNPATNQEAFMLDYLSEVASDLKFVGTQTNPRGPDADAFQKHFGTRAPGLQIFTNLRDHGAEFNLASGKMGQTLEELIASYLNYNRSLQSGKDDIIAKERTAFLKKVNELGSRTLDAEGPMSVSNLIQRAVDRHWQLALPKDSPVLAFRRWEENRAFDEALRARLNRSVSPMVGDAFKILRDGYAESVKARASKLKNRLEVDLIGNGPLGEYQRKDLFINTIGPLYDYCTLLAGIYVFKSSTSAVDGMGEYESACGPLLCWNGEGIPLYDKSLPPIHFREHQCRMMYDQAALKQMFKEKFLKTGMLCPPKPEKPIGQKVKEFFRWPGSKPPVKRPTHDAATPKR